MTEGGLEHVKCWQRNSSIKRRGLSERQRRTTHSDRSASRDSGHERTGARATWIPMNVRTVVIGWFGLVVLYTAVTRSDKIAGLLGTTTTVTRRLSDPTVPLIPDHRAGSSTSAPSVSSSGSGTGSYAQNGVVPPSSIFTPGVVSSVPSSGTGSFGGTNTTAPSTIFLGSQ